MTVTYIQLERAIGDMQQQINILVRGFNVFLPYVNKQFERIYADRATKQDIYRLGTRIDGVDGRLAGVETRLDEMGIQLSTIINMLPIDSKHKPAVSA